LSKTTKPFYKKWWFMIIAVFMALILIGAIGLIFESDETKEKREDDLAIAQQEKEEKKNVKKKEKEAKKEERKAKKKKKEDKEAKKEKDKKDEKAAKKEVEKEEADKKKKDENKAAAKAKEEEGKKAKKEKEKKAKEKKRPLDEKLVEDSSDVDEATLKDGKLTLTKEVTSFWDDTSILKHDVYKLFEVLGEGFNDKEVDQVDIVITTKMTDQKGNESIDPVVEYEYSREQFEELNYDNFLDLSYSQSWRILNESDAYSIHPGIYKNVKDDYRNNLNHSMTKIKD